MRTESLSFIVVSMHVKGARIADCRNA